MADLTPDEEQELRELEELEALEASAEADIPLREDDEDGGILGPVYDFASEFFPKTEDVVKAPVRVGKAIAYPFMHPIDTWDAVTNAPLSSWTDAGGRGALMAAGGLATGGNPLGILGGSFLYDQMGQVIGKDEDTAFPEDVSNLLGKDLPDTFLGAKLVPGAKAGTGKTGSAMSNFYDRERSLNSAISQTPADYVRGAGKVPVDEAVSRARAVGLFDDVPTEKPFETLAKRIYDEDNPDAGRLTSEGKRIDNIMGELPDGTIGDVNPKRVLSPDGTTSGSKAVAADAVASQEYEALAKKALGAEEYERYTLARQRQVELTKTETDLRMKAEARGLHGDPNMEKKIESKSPLRSDELELLDQANADVSKFEDILNSTPLSSVEQRSLKTQWGSDADYGGTDPSVTNRAEAYRKLERNAAGEIEVRAADAGLADELASANQDFGALSTLRAPLDLRAGAEKFATKPPILQRAYQAITGPRAVAGQEFLPGNPAKMLDRGLGRAPIQRAGGALEGFSARLDPYTAPAATGAAAIAGLTNPPPLAPPTEPPASPPSLRPPMSPVAVEPKQGQAFLIPRDISTIDPQGVANIMGAMLPPEQFEPIMLQWMKVTASGDKRTMGEFLGALSDAHPDFPFARGVVTGMSSEFDIGDGHTRLFSPIDKMKWEEMIDNSVLREDEKAQRILSLRKDGIVVPFEMTVNPPAREPQDLVMQQLMSTHNFKRRVDTPNGPRRVE